MPRDPRTYLWDIVQAADLVARFIAGKTYDDYLDDVLLRSAVERQFEIIGEAFRQLSRVQPDIVESVPDLPRIVGFRNILIHGYAVIDDALVWDTATNRAPALRRTLGALLDSS